MFPSSSVLLVGGARETGVGMQARRERDGRGRSRMCMQVCACVCSAGQGGEGEGGLYPLARSCVKKSRSFCRRRTSGVILRRQQRQRRRAERTTALWPGAALMDAVVIPRSGKSTRGAIARARGESAIVDRSGRGRRRPGVAAPERAGTECSARTCAEGSSPVMHPHPPAPTAKPSSTRHALTRAEGNLCTCMLSRENGRMRADT
jgi:hypothetical protein